MPLIPNVPWGILVNSHIDRRVSNGKNTSDGSNILMINRILTKLSTKKVNVCHLNSEFVSLQ